MSVLVEDVSLPHVKKAQKVYEGFSTAYARYGDLEQSNAWLDRIRKLWPLYDDDIHIEPIEENQDGLITGAVNFKGSPAQGIKVGLFMIPSTTTLIGAYDGLVDSQVPDASGRFRFEDLTSGRYYLALQGDPLILSDEDLEFLSAPGTFRLSYGAMVHDLPPIEVWPPRALSPAEDLRTIAEPALRTLPGMPARTGR